MESDGRPRLGAWVKLPVHESVELLAHAGYDFAVVDTEHAAVDTRTISTMVAAARGCDIDLYVRVPGTTPRDVQVPLDAGVDGLFVPRIDDVADAQRSVESVRFPPIGRRGASNTGRAGRWGLDTLSEYVATGNGQVRLVVQAESVPALHVIADLGSTPGVDAVFIGPADLAVSSGLLPGDPELDRLVRAAERSCATRGVCLGTTASVDAVDLIARGYDFLVLGSDTGFLRAGGAAQITAAKVAARSPIRA